MHRLVVIHASTCATPSELPYLKCACHGTQALTSHVRMSNIVHTCDVHTGGSMPGTHETWPLYTQADNTRTTVLICPK